MKTIDLVLHDWLNLSPEERKQALADVRVAETHAEPSGALSRRARALNIIASYFHFLTEGGGEDESR